MPTKKASQHASRRRRHLGADGPESVSLGRKLQEFRRTRGLLQDELARELGLNQRIISRVETGTRQIQPNELEKFKKVYGLDLDSVRVPRTTAATPLALDDEDYLSVQEALVARAETTYALWILNPESLPMLESNHFTHAWAQNLVEGFEYHTVWILDLTQREDVRRFVSRVQEVATMAADAGWQDAKSGKVYVHPVILPADSDVNPMRRAGDAARVIEYYKQLRTSLADAPIAPNLLVLGEPKPLDFSTNVDLLLFLLKFYFDPACVVAYKPRSLTGKPHVVVGLKDVVRHDDPRPQRGFCFLADASVARFMLHIEELEVLLKAEAL